MARSDVGAEAGDDEFVELKDALAIVGVAKTKLRKLFEDGTVKGRWAPDGARRRQYLRASLDELALVAPPRRAGTGAGNESAGAGRGVRQPDDDGVAEIVALRVLVDALMDALVEEAAARHRSLSALRGAVRGLDGARRAIVPADLDAALRLLQDRPG